MIKHSQVYDRHSTVSTEAVLEAVKTTQRLLKDRVKPGKIKFNGVSVNTKSLRLQTFFQKGLVCVTCGRTGTHFAIERGTGQETYHLNLWATDEQGDEYLMTHDHIIARSLGGADHISNTQPMCSPCNAEKSIEERQLLEKQS